MARLPPIKQFATEDYAGIKEILDFCSRFLPSLNLFLNSIYSAVQNGLTLDANTIGIVKQQSNILADSSGLATTSINWPYLQSPPLGVVVMSCLVSGVPVLNPLISWSYSAGVVSITMQFVKVSGGSLVVENSAAKHNITFWVSGG